MKNSGVGFDEIWIEDSCELELRSGRVQQGADDVENAGAAPLGEKFPDRHNRAECGMACGSEKEAATGRFQGSGDGLGGEVDFHAESFEDIGSAGFRGDAAVSVFDDFGSGCGDHEHGGGRDVEKARAVSAGATHIDAALTRKRQLYSAFQ